MVLLTITTATGSRYDILALPLTSAKMLTRTNENAPILNALDDTDAWDLRGWNLVLDPQGNTRARFDIEGYPPLTTSPVTGVWFEEVNILHTFLPTPA